MLNQDNRPPLGLFAIFYNGETRPVAAFVLEQDAKQYAKEYSGGESAFEIKRVHVMTEEELRQRIEREQESELSLESFGKGGCGLPPESEVIRESNAELHARIEPLSPSTRTK